MQKETVILVIVVVGFLLALIIFAFIGVVLLKDQEKKLAFRKQLEDAKNQFNQELLQSQLDIQEQTIMNIARDIHDNIGQLFSSAKHCLNTMHLKGDAEEKRLLVLDCLAKGLDDLRELSKSLSLELIRTNGLPHAIESLMSQLEKATHIVFIYQLTGNYGVMDEQREIFLFRILQEAFSNIIRHADASIINVLLDCSSPGFLKLSVLDNGRGFASDTVITSETRCESGGLNHMVARANIIGGNISIESFAGRGTNVNVTIPYLFYAAGKNSIGG